MSEKIMMSGNEAIARGVWEAGVHVAAAYPGTPSTEILENIGALYKDDIYCEWSVNEKVAFEVASGASIGGARAFCAFKHVGMNVATDPIFSMGYAGVNGGLVFVTADDPGCWSSQNEQDNRWYAPHTKIAMLEPSDSQECLDFVKAAYELSERFDTPVMIRVTTRVCHSKSLVRLGDRKDVEVRKYKSDPGKFALLPATAIARHPIREQLLRDMAEYGNDCSFNKTEGKKDAKIGVISSGISYQHAREAFGDDAAFLKLGLTYPFPEKLVKEFCSRHETLYVIEENDPYLEMHIKSLGFTGIHGKDQIPECGELNAAVLRRALFSEEPGKTYHVEAKAPARPPTMCAGCPHRGFFLALSGVLDRVVPAGDIGCYGLGSQPPFNGFGFSLCMGAGFSTLVGLSKALEKQGDPRKAIGMLGDSTFFHSGITSLIDIVSSESDVIACILDNSITAMTGHQENPGTARNLMGEPSPVVDIVALVKACGIDDDHLRVVDPVDLKAMRLALSDAIAAKGPFVIVTKRPCVLIKEVAKANGTRHAVIDPEMCIGCGMCMTVACPAIAFKDGRSVINDGSGCTGCGLCTQVCPVGAISIVEE
ncbi:MAG: indolepyruvate ferredoxin oxidoreductase subunit alpha [Oscillospiraceae bacterium]|nr:indolepyruvate ferredoxin oxidoreductase subunit alpha [Oscillospiraceae bacterium]